MEAAGVRLCLALWYEFGCERPWSMSRGCLGTGVLGGVVAGTAYTESE